MNESDDVINFKLVRDSNEHWIVKSRDSEVRNYLTPFNFYVGGALDNPNLEVDWNWDEYVEGANQFKFEDGPISEERMEILKAGAPIRREFRKINGEINDLEKYLDRDPVPGLIARVIGNGMIGVGVGIGISSLVSGGMVEQYADAVTSVAFVTGMSLGGSYGLVGFVGNESRKKKRLERLKSEPIYQAVIELGETVEAVSEIIEDYKSKTRSGFVLKD